MIVAAAQNNVIGKEGQMPWRLASDMAHFKRITSGKPVLMGRKTWQSLFVQPLPGRDNLVLSRDENYRAKGAIVFHDLPTMIAKAKQLTTDEAIIIGGEALYRATLSMCERLYVSRVACNPKGDRFFPELDPDIWRLVRQMPNLAGSKDDFAFVTQVFERV